MNYNYNSFIISDDKTLIQIDRVHEMLSKTYWADKRTKQANQKAIENSWCFGVYKDELQVGFARIVSDYAVMYYLADVIIEKEYRGLGIGKELVKFITEQEELKDLVGFLGTKDAHKLYEKYNFKCLEGVFMRKASPSEGGQNNENTDT